MNVVLGRDDQRNVSSVTAGDWTLEVVGHSMQSRENTGGYIFR
jgi:hypothetical protein